MSLSVIGAGLGRTGTHTLKLALEQLGFGPCYHMREVFAHLDTHVAVWNRAASGEAVDWDELFAEYLSAVDLPTSAFAVGLAAHYPAAKVILTERDPERWFRSFSDTISHPMSEELPDHLAAWSAMVRKAIVDRVFDGDITDKAHVIACYERHNAMVRRSIPADRLLVFAVADGWEPLCGFLGVPIPAEPFPKSNSTDEWRERSVTRFGRLMA